MIVPDDVNKQHEGDNVQTSKEKKNQIKEERKRSSLFAKITKYFTFIM